MMIEQKQDAPARVGGCVEGDELQEVADIEHRAAEIGLFLEQQYSFLEMRKERKSASY